MRTHFIFLLAAASLSLFLSLFRGEPAAAVSGELVKGASSAAVYYEYNGKRYAFPNEKVFFTWYPSFSQVRTITDSELAVLPLGGNVTYRPGIKMVKIVTDPKVYAVASNGVLRWITTQSLASEYFGPNWNTRIDDVSDAFFSNYQIGEPINHVNEYQMMTEMNANTTFVPPIPVSHPPSAAVLSKPTLISPMIGASISSATTDIYFTWNASQHAVSYDLLLYRNGVLMTTYPANGNTGLDISFSQLNLVPGQNTFYWQVRANGMNNDSLFSDQSYFTITVPAANVPTPPVSGGQTLWNLYQIKPTQADIDTITNDFHLVWQEEPGLTWPNDFLFDQTSTVPSKIVIISKLNVLRRQTFSEPLPFTNGKSIYDYVKTYLSGVPLSLTCAGGLNWSVWDGRSTADCLPSANPSLYPYVHQLQLFVHEARHLEPGDPGHVSCGISVGNDQVLENGSGYSAAAIYLMWVYKYSINESPIIKEVAKLDAIDLLKTRFCTKPTHSNPKVQSIIDELLQ